MSLTKKLLIALFAVISAVAASAAYWKITDTEENATPVSEISQRQSDTVYK